MPEDNRETANFGAEAWRPLASAFRAWHRGDRDAVLLVHADDGDSEIMPVSAFFRTRETGLRDVDEEAVELARGRILDGGAGVGSITLLLQELGRDVTAVEVIPEAVQIMGERGVRNPVRARLDELEADHAFDTVLLLMNGTALAGTLAGLPELLETVQGLLAPGGQLLLDSTDLTGGENPPWTLGGYPGELQYQIEFEGEKGAPFPQLFVDFGTLAGVAGKSGWESELVLEGEDGEYLARLTRR